MSVLHTLKLRTSLCRLFSELSNHSTRHFGGWTKKPNNAHDIVHVLCVCVCVCVFVCLSARLQTVYSDIVKFRRVFLFSCFQSLQGSV